MTIKDAKHTINYAIKEGYIDDELYSHLNDEELIELAEYLMEQGDIAYDVWKEQYDN